MVKRAKSPSDGHYDELPVELQGKLKCPHCGSTEREWKKGPSEGICGYYVCAECKQAL